MYNPPKSGQYIEMFTQVYNQGQELARKGEMFDCPYREIISPDPMYSSCVYDYVPVSSIENDFFHWFYNGYYDYGCEENKIFLKPAVLKVKKIAVKKVTKKKATKKKTSKKLSEVEKE